MIKAYIARPKAAGKDAPVMAIQEKRGLDPHTEAITRRAAPEGSLAIAPDHDRYGQCYGEQSCL